ncbi:MAG: hypothetical protein GX456_11685 [Verrucomicrobia bacterium]|nr:hypothetical protein [Verrucomicrobiota bacterium]
MQSYAKLCKEVYKQTTCLSPYCVTKIHSDDKSGRMGLDGHCANHETHETHEKLAVIVRAFSPSIVESDVEMALVVGLRPTLVWTAPLALR